MDLDALWGGFCDPPDEARPRAWWHWMDGNVDPEGIRLDLEWLHRVGVRGVQMFDGGMGTPLVVPEKVSPGSPAWLAAVELATTTARELGLEFAVTSSAGWSAAGGPWVEPADAMKKVVWSETPVTGGRPVEVPLRPLPDVAGAYQDSPRGRGAPRFAQDWIVVAVPADIPPILVPAEVSASGPVDDWRCLVDGGFAATIALPRDPDGPSSAWLEQDFGEPVRVGAVTVGLPAAGGFGAAPPPDAVLEASDDGVHYRPVADLPQLVEPAGKAAPVRTVAFAPVTARRFRLVLSGGSAADALPPLAEGVAPPPILRRSSEFLVSEFALSSGGRVHHGPLKAGFAAALDYEPLDGAAGTSGIDPAHALDLTAHLDDSGVLRWDAPAGEWLVLRLGASLTGQTNGPAPPEATGLEVDKFDSVRVRRYLDTHLGRFGDVEIDALLSDSIESGPQNFTDELRARFTELRGYDPLPWLPTLAGYVVRNAERSDRFLWDHRRTLAELLASEYYGTLAAVAHERGWIYYAEALEDHRPQLGDDLAMRSHTDVPMGAMWLFDAGTGSPQPTYLADLKGASSVAHVYDKPFTGAESMTAFHRPWSYTPRRLKHIADLELALGVTRFCIHTSPHQPTQVPPPGIGLAPFLGQAFIRTEPWADMAGPWIEYLARCSWLLNQGAPAVDVAVFVGEEAPLTAIFGTEPDRSVPAGFDHDYLNLDALEDRLTVDDGELAAGSARYRLLYLGGSTSRMTVRALRRIAEHARLCAQLWADGGVLDTDLGVALAQIGASPSLTVEGADLLRIGRRIGDGEVVFLANPVPEPVTVRVAAERPLVVWDPVTLRRRPLSGPSLDLPALGSVFLLPGGLPQEPAVEATVVPLDGPWRLTLPGVLDTELDDGARPWTDLGAAAAGFAGVGTYTTEVVLDDVGARAILDLGDVGDLARVRMNGTDVGVVWTAPWRIDVTAAVRPGRNAIEVDVANAWMNRLVAEAQAPTGEIFAPVAGVYAPDAPLHASGLLGSVTLEIAPAS